MPNLAAMVLAAGGSTRMGRPKQLLHFRGRTFLRHACEMAVELECSPIVVVLGSRAEDCIPELAGLPVQAVINSDWQKGIGSSIRLGTSHILGLNPAVEGILILLGDQPLVATSHLRELIAGYFRSGKAACVSAYADTIGPPVIVGHPLFPRLRCISDNQGAKALWQTTPDIVATVQCEAAAFDVDTEQDYDRLSGGSTSTFTKSAAMPAPSTTSAV